MQSTLYKLEPGRKTPAEESPIGVYPYFSVLAFLNGQDILILRTLPNSDAYMKIERFHSLSMPQQHYYTMKCGTYLLTRHERNFSVHLFGVGCYYVEIYYEHGETACSLIRSFQSTIFLEPYLQAIDVTVLLEE